MKKNYFLTGAFLLASTLTFAQQNKMIGNEASMNFSPLTADELKINSSINNDKAFGDTLFYEDFGTGFSTNGWVSRDVGANGFDWTYTTTNPTGNYTATLQPIASTTGANGFAALFSDFYNTSTPQTAFLNMDSYLTSGPITVTPKGSVFLRWQQSLRYCCNSGTVQMLVEVSTDSSTWVSYNAKAGISVNTATTQSAEINISAVAANASTIYLRFYQGASSHYYWMIDDVALVEGPASNVRLSDIHSSFGSKKYEGYYTQVPAFQSQPLSFFSDIENNGSFAATGVKLKVDIEKGSTNVYTDSSAAATLAPLQVQEFNIANAYANLGGMGDYSITYNALDDSVNQVPASAVRQIDYKISDTVFARDYGVPGATVGPGSYVNGDVDGSRIGLKYTLDTAAFVTSISYYIADRADVVGAEMRAKIWSFDTTQASLNGAFITVVAENPLPYIITTADRGTWKTINMLQPVSLPAGQYAVVGEQSSGNSSNFRLYFGRDVESEKLQPFGSDPLTSEWVTFVYAAGAATPSWGWIMNLPMIRLNVQATVDINEINETVNDFTVSPNPNNGQFKVNISALNAKFTLNVRNIMGQVVYTENVSVQNSLSKEINLSNLDKGIYFVSVENEVSKEVKKVVIR